MWHLPRPMGNTSSQIEPYHHQNELTFVPGVLQNTPQQRVRSLGPSDDDLAASQQLLGEHDMADAATDDELPRDTMAGSQNTLTHSERKPARRKSDKRDDEKNKKNKNKKNKKKVIQASGQAATSLHTPFLSQPAQPATPTAPFTTRFPASAPQPAAAREVATAEMPSSPPEVNDIEGWPLSPPTTQPPDNISHRVLPIPEHVSVQEPPPSAQPKLKRRCEPKELVAPLPKKARKSESALIDPNHPNYAHTHRAASVLKWIKTARASQASQVPGRDQEDQPNSAKTPSIHQSPSSQVEKDQTQSSQVPGGEQEDRPNSANTPSIRQSPRPQFNEPADVVMQSVELDVIEPPVPEPSESPTEDVKKTKLASNKTDSKRLIGAAKELATVRELSDHPDVRSDGGWTNDEHELIRRAMKKYQTDHGLGVQGLVDLIQFKRGYKTGLTSKGKGRRVNESHALDDVLSCFWTEIAAVLPNRSRKSIKHAVQAKYHSNKGGGGWTEEEDKKLKEVYDEYPNQWTLIAERMGNRDARSCQARWIDYGQLGLKRVTQKWSSEEEQKLRQAVEDNTDESTGAVKWVDVVEAVTTRSRIQIIQKWAQLQKRIKKRSKKPAQTNAKAARKKAKASSSRKTANSPRSKTSPTGLQSSRAVKRSVAVDSMRMGDYLDIMQSIVDTEVLYEGDSLDWQKVSRELKRTRWSPEECKQCFDYLLRRVGFDNGKTVEFETGLLRVLDFVAKTTSAERDDCYGKKVEEEL